MKPARSPHRILLIGLAGLMLGACMLRDLQDQIDMLDQACLIEGEVAGPEPGAPIVVIAIEPGDAQAGRAPGVIDYTLSRDDGTFSFAMAPGRYRLLAFRDRDGDLELDDDEPARHVQGGSGMECAAGGRLDVSTVTLAASDRIEASRHFAVQGRGSLLSGALASAVSLGQLTAFGEVVELSDQRFDLEHARDSLWRPVDFLRNGYEGVYLQEAFDPERTPVLFIHGINGSPRVLEPLIDQLDTGRFQPMYFYYASGLRIDHVVWHLDRIMREIEHRHGIERYHVIAHSMGGLVAREWLLRRATQPGRNPVASFLSLSTPWGGYPSARQGVDHSPVVVPVWRDMASGSDFLERLFDPQRAEQGLPAHHLLFSFRSSGWLANSSGDGVAALSSMLPPQVQLHASSVFGVDTGHVEILSDPTAQARVNALLRSAEDANSTGGD